MESPFRISQLYFLAWETSCNKVGVVINYNPCQEQAVTCGILESPDNVAMPGGTTLIINLRKGIRRTQGIKLYAY